MATLVCPEESGVGLVMVGERAMSAVLLVGCGR